jgi:acetyltransferase
MRANGQPEVKSAAGLDACDKSSSGSGPAGDAETYRLKNGSEITIRPICPADERLMIRFHRALSEQSVYYRYLGPLKLSQRIAHQRLARVCRNYQASELALVAKIKFSHAGGVEILGVGRLAKADDSHEAEFALVVADRHQNAGLGVELLRRVIVAARKEGQSVLVGYILPDNRPMLHICEKLGFRRVHSQGDPVVKMELDLPVIAPSTAPRLEL